MFFFGNFLGCNKHLASLARYVTESHACLLVKSASLLCGLISMEKVSTVFGVILQNRNTRKKKKIWWFLKLLLVYFHVKTKPFWGVEEEGGAVASEFLLETGQNLSLETNPQKSASRSYVFICMYIYICVCVCVCVYVCVCM